MNNKLWTEMGEVKMTMGDEKTNLTGADEVTAKEHGAEAEAEKKFIPLVAEVISRMTI